MPGTIGNQNARRAKELRDALNYALNNFENSAIKKGQALRAIGGKLVEMGLDGNLAAIKEIGDRIDGKPAQTTIIEDDNRDIEDFNIDELKQMLSDLRSADAIEAKKKEHTNGN